MDRYAVSSLVGQGSFGCVYKAQRRDDDKVVAIKVISKVRLELLPSVRKRKRSSITN